MTKFSESLSRRDFLKLSGFGLAGAFLPKFAKTPATTTLLIDQQARVAEKSIQLYESPSFDSEPVRSYWRDIVLPLTSVHISEDEEAYNRVWYRLGTIGYAYSGGIQPVRTMLNEPMLELPPDGALAEVSVPFTEAREGPSNDFKFIYRLYYETTHWIIESIIDEETQEVWYQLSDDKWKNESYYVRATHLRVFSAADLAPISPDVPAYRKVIEVRLAQQLVIAYEGKNSVFAARAATGARFATGKYYTPEGDYKTYHKRPSRHMAAGDIASNGYDLPGVPWVLYITESGISFHGTYWHNDYGSPRSHGCINLAPQVAKWLFRWTMPTVPAEKQFVYGYAGTHVVIR